MNNVTIEQVIDISEFLELDCGDDAPISGPSDKLWREKWKASIVDILWGAYVSDNVEIQGSGQ